MHFVPAPVAGRRPLKRLIAQVANCTCTGRSNSAPAEADADVQTLTPRR